MSDGDTGFAPPPFRPEEGHVKLRRELRALGLGEREGRFERRGQVVARAALTDGHLQAAMVKRPARSSPEWQVRSLDSDAALREFVAELKKRLVGWSERDE